MTFFNRNKFEGALEGGESPEQENNKEREKARFEILTKLGSVAQGGMEKISDDDRIASEAKKLMNHWREELGDEEYKKLEEKVWGEFSLRYSPGVVKRTRDIIESVREEDENEGMAAAA